MASIIYFVVSAVTVLYVQCISRHLCNAECPPHKPYYTDAGCVYKCPKDFHINGSSCIVTCGDWFTNKNRECQLVCPDSYFVREVVRAVGWDSYLEKQCVASCDSTEFIFNGTCVEACPTDLRYIVNKTCVNSCPDGFSFLNNFTKSDLLYYECFGTCPLYEENGYCTNSCSEGRLQYDYICVETCPKLQQYIYGSQCLKQCPVWLPLDANNTCVMKCPPLLPFIHNSSCVGKCPKEFPNSDIGLDGSEYCVDVCGPKRDRRFLFNNKCVSKCPNYTYNRTCMNKCPNDFPIANNVTIGINCRSDSECTKILQYSECVDECPSGKFLLLQENACVESCPSNMVLSNRTCLHFCNEKAPYSQETTFSVSAWSYEEDYSYTWDRRMVWKNISKKETTLQCVNDCSEDNLQLNNTCVHTCPGLNDMPVKFETPWNITSQYFRYSRTCVKRCPEDHAFVSRSYLKERKEPCRSWNCDEIIWYLECVAECPNNTYIYRNMCLKLCPDQLFLLRKTCVESCPKNQHLQLDREVNIGETENQISRHLECVAECPENTYIYRNMCSKSCPDHLFLLGKTCVKSCPQNQHLQLDREINIGVTEKQIIRNLECVAKCPNNTYIYRNMCSKFCPDHLFLLGKTCIESCPQKQHLHLDRKVNIAVTEKQNGLLKTTKRSFFECVSNCGEKLVYNNSCVDNCPVTGPYLYGNVCHNNRCGTRYELKTSKGIECLSECPEGTLRSANKCTTKCPDELKYNFNSVCVKQCPSSKPFGVDINKDTFSFDDKKSEFKCLAKCEDDKIYKQDEGACIYSYECDDPYFAFAGQCLKRCPHGYRWFLSCFHRTAALICTLIMISLMLIYSLCCLSLFKETLNLITKCRQYTKHCRREDRAEKLLQLWGKEESDNPGKTEYTSLDLADTTVIIQTFNNSYINTAFETDINV